MFDDERYGQQIATHPETLPEVYRLWRQDHGGEPLDVFAQWVGDWTGKGLFDLLTEDQVAALGDYLAGGEVEDENEDVDMLIEGLESGP